MRPLTEMQRRVLVAYAESGMNASEAARRLWLHPNSVTNHLKNIQRKTQLDTKKVCDLVALLAVAGASDYIKVVRCGCCRRRDKSQDMENSIFCPALGRVMRREDYCSFGEPPDEGEKGADNEQATVYGYR